MNGQPFTAAARQLSYDHLVFIGRFQPLHNGHMAILQEAVTLARRVLIVLGSANQPRSPRNPFTEVERREMILGAIGEVDPGLRERVGFVPVRDCYDDDRWRDAVKRAVSQAIGDAASRVGVIGHVKDASSKYLRSFQRWPFVEMSSAHAVSATAVRAAFLSSAAWSEHELFLAHSVPPAVLAFLEAFGAEPDYRELAEAYAWAQEDRAKWPKTPYPVLTNTVDAVVRCSGHVLMIKRRNFPGRGLWALPGGHVDEYELLKDAALRELKEETGLDAIAGGLESCLRATHTFDYPWRSQRGRVITQAYYFELPLRDPPAVRGSDDAVEARWVPETELPEMETRIHDDHLHIIEHFLNGSHGSVRTLFQ